MASDFVRNIKGIRNIDILSPNITTENDLISTSDGEVYVVTNKGYRKITGVETKEIKQLKTDVSNVKIQSDSNTLNISDNTDDIDTNTSDIETLKTTTENNTSEIETLKTTTGNNTSEIETLQTTTGNNTSEIETLQTTTDNNTSEIETLQTSTGKNTSEIETLKTSTGKNTSEIETLKTSTSNNETNIDSTQTLIEKMQKQFDELKSNTKKYYTLFEGSANGVGTDVILNDDYTDYKFLFISGTFPGGVFTETFSLKNKETISISKTNLLDTDGNGGGLYELKIGRIDKRKLKISNDVFYDIGNKNGSGSDANKFTIKYIEGWK